MALLPLFNTPGFLADVPAGSPFYLRWSNYISDILEGTTPADGGGALYDATKTEVAVTGGKMLTWMAFPRAVLLNAANRDDKQKAYTFADADVAKRDPQNEYIEWYVHRNAAGRITKVTFVTEPPEYYDLLWQTDRAAVVNLYRTLVSPEVKEADLKKGNKYNKFNRWNTKDGIVHYIQQANSVFAAVDLARRATKSTTSFRDNYEAKPGLATALTSADPRISFDLHMMMRKGLYVTLANPIGLYIAGWDGSGITQPNGKPAGDYWRIVRGVPGMVLRLEYEVPASAGFVVGDLQIGGRPIEFGGQLAELITVRLAATAGITGKAPL